MKNRKELKHLARHSLKEHLGIWILLCAVFLWLSGEPLFENPITYYQQPTKVVKNTAVSYLTEGSAFTAAAGMRARYLQILDNFLEEQYEDNHTLVESHISEVTENEKEDQILGRTRGVLSTLVNQVSSGSFLVTMGVAVNSMIHSNVGTVFIFILLSLILYLVFWVFFLNILRVILARMFLEGRLYDRIHLGRLLFVFRSGHWFNVSRVLLLQWVYQTLWDLTIIGGMIKHYSYYLVPYIIAENPTITPKKAIRLSRTLMYGHKWELFKLHLSFLGWWLLGILTFGIAHILFVGPYEEATNCEFYASLRENSVSTDIPDIQLLNDQYLYRYPSQVHLDTSYKDVVALLTEANEKKEETPLTGIFLWLARIFGITIRNTQAERDYSSHMAIQQRLYFEKEAYTAKTYPGRLHPLYKNNATLQETAHSPMNPMRCYSIWSMILIFFTTSLIGWLWEVFLHLISDGVFVNRGVLHGPWLPIYGTGSVLMLVVLYRLRKNPLLEFFSIILVCGVVEYWTAYYLELTHDGKKWWDYTGYFLNLHGRICAEGLLVFGLGGLAIVYMLAPLLDNLFKKIPFKVIVPLCLLLVAIYLTDNTYSSKHPNEGEGITDYAFYQTQEEMPTYLL